MGRKVKQLKNYTTEQVESLLASDENHRTGVKLYAILQLTRGYSSRSLEEFFRTSFKQICNWADRFDAEGVKGLHIKPGRGRHTRLTVDQRHQLKTDLLHSPKNFGYNSVQWSGSLIGEHILKTYQIEYKQSAIYNLMRKIGFSFCQGNKFRE
jgi:putative transposase